MTIPFLPEILPAFPKQKINTDKITVTNTETLPSWFDVTDLATASITAAGLMLAPNSKLTINPRLASIWFGLSIKPINWELPPIWDAIAGNYRTKDGWIRLHTNAPHHRDAALSVLGDYKDREALSPIIANWNANELETAIVEANGCAAEMRSIEDWQNHPQGNAVSQEPLIHWETQNQTPPTTKTANPQRPLEGIKVLDLTRVLAGPVAGRFLAYYGADVLRIDPPDWNEDAVVPEVTLGKRCAGLNLKTPEDRTTFEALLKEADILLHGYRPEALINLGYTQEQRIKINPTLINITLNAYGWTGPWKNRRGFDSLVQMSSGIAEYGMKMANADKPTPLPVQALDHATGYLLAAATIYALNQRHNTGEVLSAKLSLAKTATLLIPSKRTKISQTLSPKTDQDFTTEIENTSWGPAHRAKFPLHIEGTTPEWNYPAGKLRRHPASW